jgi:hypothetical protein
MNMAESALKPGDGELLVKAGSDTKANVSPLAVDRASYAPTIASLRESQHNLVMPAAFGIGNVQLIRGVEPPQQADSEVARKDAQAVLKDVVGGKGWSAAGKAAWKDIFNKVAGDPIDEAQGINDLTTLARAFKHVDIYSVTDSKGNEHYYAGLVRPGAGQKIREDHLNWTKASSEAVSRGEPIPEIPKSLPTLMEIGTRALPKELAPLLADARKGDGLSQEGAKALKNIFENSKDLKGTDENAQSALAEVQNRINSAVGQDRLRLDKKTEPNGTERYYATIEKDGKAAQSTDVGSRELPNEYKPILEAVKGTGIPADRKLVWNDAARQGWQKSYDYLSNLPDATPESIQFGLNALGARMNNAVGQDRVGIMAAVMKDKGAGWVMSVGRSSAERVGALLGGNPDAAVKLGPFVPKTQTPKPPGTFL